MGNEWRATGLSGMEKAPQVPKPTGNNRPLVGGRNITSYTYSVSKTEAGATGVGIVLMPSHAALQMDARGINEITVRLWGKEKRGMISTIMRSTGRPATALSCKKACRRLRRLVKPLTQFE